MSFFTELKKIPDIGSFHISYSNVTGQVTKCPSYSLGDYFSSLTDITISEIDKSTDEAKGSLMSTFQGELAPWFNNRKYEYIFSLLESKDMKYICY